MPKRPDTVEIEDLKWKQRAKQNQYQNGDRNTKFFHAWESHRRKINHIGKILDDGGWLCTESKDISKAFIQFYHNLFTTEITERIEDCISALDARVIEDMNMLLLKEFSNEKIAVLIRFVSNPSKLTEYIPISLQNVLYKLIAKVLANRLKKVLPCIISQNQSAIIPRRLISENILVAYEALHTMDPRMKGNEGYMALNLGMSKAQDRVNRNFYEKP